MPVVPHGAVFAGASIRGAAHKLHNLPNQDAFGGSFVGDCNIIAVSDGHGARPHFRSDRGARFAVDAMHQALAECLAEWADSSRSARPQFLQQRCPDRIVNIWRDLVVRDEKADPIDKSSGTGVEIAYGATCIVACLGPGFSFFAQLGDGDLVAATANGSLVKPLADDRGLVGEQTYSLCQKDAPARFRTALHMGQDELARPAFVLVSTDGLSKSFARKHQFLDVVRDLAKLSSAGDMDALSRNLEPWLAQVSEHGNGDDVTVMLFRDATRQMAYLAPPSNWKTVLNKLQRLWT